MSATRNNTYARAILREALVPWLEQLRAAARAVRTADGGGELSRALPATLRPEAHRLVQLLAREGDLDQLPEIIRELEALITEEGESGTAVVTTAIEMSGEERAALEQRLRQRFGADLIFDYEVDPALLGGVRVRVGDRVIDNTVAARLEAMRERITG